MPLFTNEVDSTTTNGLTDTQLRATPVPISGTVTTGGLTDTELRATPVPVSGPLTDAQLRATPVPVTSGSLATATVTRAAVTAVVSTVLSSAPTRTKFIIYNETGTLFVKLGTGASTTDYSQRLTANSVWEYAGYSGIVTVIKQTGSTFAQVTSVE